jgi:hypothetical protein
MGAIRVEVMRGRVHPRDDKIERELLRVMMQRVPIEMVMTGMHLREEVCALGLLLMKTLTLHQHGRSLDGSKCGCTIRVISSSLSFTWGKKLKHTRVQSGQ